MSELVPFGKYKGRSVEELVADRAYCEWLGAQPWFRDKFVNLYQRVVVINPAEEPQDTPEHNKLQARFLNPDYCRALLLTAFPKGCEQRFREHNDAARRNLEDALEKHPKLLEKLEEARQKKYSSSYISDLEWKLKNLDALIKENSVRVERDATIWGCFGGSVAKFESCGIDVAIEHPVLYRVVAVEIKPTIGDDYPTILRKMSMWTPSRGSDMDRVGGVIRCLVFNAFNAEGVSEIQMRQIFAASDISVVSFAEIDATLQRYASDTE